LWQLGLDNHALMRAQLAEYEVDCNYQVEGFWFLAREDMPDHQTTLQSYRTDFELLSEDGFEVEWLDRFACRERGGNPLFTGGFGYLTDAQFHSGKYVTGLAQGIARKPGVQLFEQTRVAQVEPVRSPGWPPDRLSRPGRFFWRSTRWPHSLCGLSNRPSARNGARSW
jgi:glycine/D-amino acid oxidase-like deaminating enzyme